MMPLGVTDEEVDIFSTVEVKRPNLDFFLTSLTTGEKYSQEIRKMAEIALTGLREHKLGAEKDLKSLLRSLSISDNFIETHSWDELSTNFNSLKGECFLDALEQYMGCEHSFKEGLGEIETLREALTTNPTQNEAMKACNDCFHNTFGHFLDAEKGIKPWAPTRYALLVGAARLRWSHIDREYFRLFHQPPHQFCGCHALAHRVTQCFPGLSKQLIPLNAPLSLPQKAPPFSAETVAIFGCHWGNSHKFVAETAANLCRDELGACVYTFDLPDDVLPPSEDPIYNNAFFKGIGFESITQFFNALMKESAFAVINIALKTSTKRDLEGEARRALYIMWRLLETRPTFVITTYSWHNEELIQACCQYFGIPLLHLPADLIGYTTTRDTPPQTDHFNMAMPVDFPDAAQVGKVTKEQLVISGPPVRMPFMKERTFEDNNAFRAKWNIPEGKKVVIFSDTGNGASLKFITKMDDYFEDVTGNPYHCIVLCKGDRALEQKVRELNLPYVHPCLYANAEQMEELVTMTAYGGAIVGKSGGSTAFEALSRGARILVPNLPLSVFGMSNKHTIFSTFNRIASWWGCENQLPWEKRNYEYLKGRSQAREFHTLDQMVPELLALTIGQDSPVSSKEIPRFKDQFLALIPQMLQKARNDERMRELQNRVENTL